MSGSDGVSLVGEPFEENGGKWHDSVWCPSNGCVYGIPHDARKVIKFDPKDKSSTEIGVDLGDGHGKWFDGVFVPKQEKGKITKNCIYGIPRNAKFILKIDTDSDEVETISMEHIADLGDGRNRWGYGALADDGQSIYCFPARASKILKIDLSNDRIAISTVGNPLGGEQNYRGTVKAKNGWMVGIPNQAKRIVKFDPKNPDNGTTLVGEEHGEKFECRGGALAEDGKIYAVTVSGQILEIDVESNSHSIFGEKIANSNPGWMAAIDGKDGNIYFLPAHEARVLKYNTLTKKVSLKGDNLGNTSWKYTGASYKTSDGRIYSLPYDAKHVLSVETDPPRQHLSHQNVNGAIHDSPNGEPDRLGYSIYAEGLCTVAQNVETPITSLCVALYAPWGTGKSFLYNLIETKLPQRAKKEEEEIKKKIGKEQLSIHQKSLNTVLNWLCAIVTFLCVLIFFISRLVRLILGCVIFFIPAVLYLITKCLCILVSCCQYDLDMEPITSSFSCTLTCDVKIESLKDFYPSLASNISAETIATVIALFLPIWILLLLLGYVLRFLQLSVYHGITWLWGKRKRLVKTTSGDKFMCTFKYKPLGEEEEKDEEMQIKYEQVGNKEEDKEIQKPRVTWDDVWNIFTKKTSLHANEPFPKRNCFAKVRFLLLTVAINIFNNIRVLRLKIVPYMRCRKEYDENSKLIKYIFVKLNAWVYNGADDLLWASLLEAMWKKVELECGKYNVRLHRAKIAMSGEVGSDDTNTKRSKREAAMMIWGIKILFWLVVASAGACVLFIWKPDFIEDFSKKLWRQITAQVALSAPFLVVFVDLVRKIVPYLLKSRGSEIFRKASSLGNKRMDFTQKTGFMGEVKKEVDYLFDFIRTTPAQDDVHRALCPYRLSVFVDDLDRCSAETIMEVLQVVVLLLVDAPVTCWLAIDSRLVVASIEKSFGGQFTEAGLDGYKFLEKIVQLPFCFPDLRKQIKINFLHKVLEKDELDPLRVYNRGRYLILNEVSFKAYQDIFLVKEINEEDEKDIMGVLAKMFDKMIEKDVFKDVKKDFMITRPTDINERVKKALDPACPDEDMALLESKDFREEFLHYVSIGIQCIIKVSRNSESSIGPKSSGESNRDREEPEIVVQPVEKNINPSGQSPEQGNAQSIGNENPVEPNLEQGNVFDNQEYKELYQPMANESEMQSFTKIAAHITGEPRKMKRIINSYMLSRFIAERMKGPGTGERCFHDKLLKLIVLCELWPYRMAWLMIVLENLQQEKDVMSRRWNAPVVGSTLIDIFKKLKRDNDGVDKCEDLPLIEVYKYIVEGLLHSPKDAHVELQRDGDPQVFDMLLLDDQAIVDDGIHDSQLKCCDISSSYAKDSNQQTSLRPYIFNHQRHMMEKVQLYIDNFVLYLPTDRDHFKVIKYEMKSEVFRIKQQVISHESIPVGWRNPSVLKIRNLDHSPLETNDVDDKEMENELRNNPPEKASQEMKREEEKIDTPPYGEWDDVVP